MRARSHLSLPQRQTRLTAFQGLALALFIAAQHNSLLRRSQIEADNVPKLLLELLVVGQLEGAGLVRLQIVAEPQLLHPTLGQPGVLGACSDNSIGRDLSAVGSLS